MFDKLILKTIYNLKIDEEFSVHFSPTKKKFQLNLSTFSNKEKEKIHELLNPSSELSKVAREVAGFQLVKENRSESKNNFTVFIESVQQEGESSKLKFDYEKMEISSFFYHSLINDSELTVETINKENLQDFYKKIVEIQKSRTRELGKNILTKFLEYSEEEITDDWCYLMGKIKYFFSYNQNLLEHLLEVSILSSNFAFQLSLNVLKAKRAAFFHDIGKITGQYSDHVSEGVVLAKQLKLDDYIVETIQAHHNYEYHSENPYLPIVRAMDKLSAGRLGARPLQLEKTKERNDKIASLLAPLSEIAKIEFLAGGHIIKLILKAEEFKWENLESLKKKVALIIKGAELRYQYNYQFLFKLEYNDSFYLEDY
ncbi:hypothetical protein MHLP_00275 [Candidatus Mycoplasma haematolamae str. Purdue]|uniref:HD domain-containing protein n=1 Tax=Mycoplasma haematolamae (strain Purdue) TaxID=1212765 RepID=I7B8S7_MYCHA|nr:HDIG domain-containing metalloprotein [Candidatus Mycoplasma haematolamae]AFO51635.1 hypothetical protein MHLP_00275 [Candidatus Mycoplasma haematolamae str. Purdue]